MSMNLEQIRKLFLGYPGVEEAPSYGTPGFRVRKKLLARVHQSEPAVVLRVESVDAQEALIAMEPEIFYITDHYAGYAFVLARLGKVRTSVLREVFEAAWRADASKEQIALLSG
jgi:hypothetical protein